MSFSRISYCCLLAACVFPGRALQAPYRRKEPNPSLPLAEQATARTLWLPVLMPALCRGLGEGEVWTHALPFALRLHQVIASDWRNGVLGFQQLAQRS